MFSIICFIIILMKDKYERYLVRPMVTVTGLGTGEAGLESLPNSLLTNGPRLKSAANSSFRRIESIGWLAASRGFR